MVARTRWLTIWLVLTCFWFTPRIAAQPVGEARGDLFVLSVGVDSTTPPDHRDRYARDASFVRQALVRAEPLYQTTHSRVLAGDKATRCDVLKALSWLADSVTAKDVALVFFSTHGFVDDKQDFFMTLAAVTDQNPPFDIVRGPELNEALAKIRGKVVVVIDACHAGACIRPDTVKQHRATFVLACGARQASFGQFENSDRPHGYLVLAVCEALNGRADTNKDGVVTLQEFEAYVPIRVKALFPRQYVEVLQRPGSALVVLTKREKGLPADELWPAYESTNPFGEPDVPYPAGPDVLAYSESLKHHRGADDANAKPWSAKAVKGSNATLDGEWESRWKINDKEANWRIGTAKVKTIGDRVFVHFKDGSDGEYLIDLRRAGEDKLVGRYMNLNLQSDSSPWVGFAVSPERIDGYWPNGRWDLRRKLAGK
jgi:hypothetical protein